ncbi:MAG: amidinotransferase [Bacteroidia bacterium]|nr:amidinotransferase [Bacteroidia bacterium]
MTLASKVLMVEPEHFQVNPEIVSDNFFVSQTSFPNEELKAIVRKEFEGLKSKLTKAGIEVVSFQPYFQVPAPDAVFPNNWFSTHTDGTLVIYPMMSPLRRNERHTEILKYLKGIYRDVIDLSSNENQSRFLEGTGSIVINHSNKIAFASESARTNSILFYEWCERMKHTPVLFHATDENGRPIYHTNVMLTIAENIAIICMECIRDEREQKLVRENLLKCGLKIFEINFEQVKCFSGNTLALINKSGEQILAVSEQGWKGLNEQQRKFLLNHCAEIIIAPLTNIEACGGGSARCMIAELY